VRVKVQVRRWEMGMSGTIEKGAFRCIGMVGLWFLLGVGWWNKIPSFSTFTRGNESSGGESVCA
jgi:hypothetical protein